MNVFCSMLLISTFLRIAHCLLPAPTRRKFARDLSMASSSTSTSSSRQHRILCYGDSLTAGTIDAPFELYPYAPHLETALNKDNNNNSQEPHFVVRHRGMSGWTAAAMVSEKDHPSSGLRSAIQGIKDPSLSCVVILAGTNDLEGDELASKILRPVTALHELAWQEGVPRTVAIAIPPSAYQSSVSVAARTVQEVNQQLEEYCRASQGKALFVPFPFGYERNGENWSTDGLHFSPRGYQVLGEHLAAPVSQLLKEL